MSERTDHGIREFQALIARVYGERDQRRGVPGTFMWFVEEVGELARCFTDNSTDRSVPDRSVPDRSVEEREFADCLAWLVTLASLRGIDLSGAAWSKYGAGCPRCRSTPCTCAHR